MRPCPLLAGSCRAAGWVAGSWGNCSLPGGLTCGEGVRVRGIGCARCALLNCSLCTVLHGDRAGVSLPLSACADLPPPPQWQLCTLDCSDQQCALSAWSAWSVCSHQQCGQARSRTRSTAGLCPASQLLTRQVQHTTQRGTRYILHST